MTLEQLEYLVEVAKVNSISTAAGNLHVSQSAVSQAIINIENELQIKLFTRRKHGTFLTDKGEKIVDKAKKVLKALSELQEEVDDQKSFFSGKIEISVIPGLASSILKSTAVFKKYNKNIDIHIKEQATQDIITEIEKGQTDFGVISINENLLKRKDLIFEPLRKGKMQVYTGKDTPWVIGDTINPIELKDLPIILYNSDFSRAIAEDILRKYGSINVVMTLSTTEAAKRAIIDGMGVSFIPDYVMENDPYVLNNKIKGVSIVNYEQETISLGFVHSKNMYLSVAIKEFINHLQSEFKKA